MRRHKNTEYPAYLEDYREICLSRLDSTDPSFKAHGTLLEVLAPKNSTNTPEAVKIWRNLHERWHKDDYNKQNHNGFGFRFWWLTSELDRVIESQKTPQYATLRVSERKDLADEIQSLGNRLSKLFQKHELDGHLIHYKSLLFGEWHIYEDCRDKDKEWLSEHGSEKILLSIVIDFCTKRAVGILSEAEHVAKKGKNAAAVIFIRKLVTAHNESIAYGTPLYEVAAIFTNWLYQTNYDASSARKIVLG